MCGIAGYFNYAGVVLRDEDRWLEGMSSVMAHRGPDDSGLWLSADRRVGLGHRRLSILDLSRNGHQPMAGREGTVIVYNGEVYNFRELRAEMGEKDFQSHTDTEVVLRAYEKHGDGFVERLNGMFAFGIWDEGRGRLLLARDRAGIKPLYYTTMGGVFSFASEIKALLVLPWVRARMDERALYDFLSFNCLDAPATMFEGISKLAPGHRMVVDGRGPGQSAPFWVPRKRDWGLQTEEDWAGLVLDTLRRSVRSQMVSDVPVGAFLSGGVDSSALVALMEQTGTARIKTYSIGFEGAPDYDELDYARRVSRTFGTEHIERVVRPREIVEFLPKIVDIFDEPLADATSIPIHFISALARENGTIVVQTGDGSDELFCGYRRWLRYRRVFPWYRMFCRLPKAARAGIMRMYQLYDHGSAAHEMLSHAVHGHRYLWGTGGFRESTKRSFLSGEFIRRLNGHASYDAVLASMRDFESFSSARGWEGQVEWLSYQGFRGAVPNVYLYRGDHLGMANSVELRVPFLDNELIDVALSVPARWKVRHGEPKYVLKRALEPVLSREILYRKKMGFCVPLREWMGAHMLQYVEENLERFCRDTGYFDVTGLKGQVEATRSGSVDYAFSLWNIYFLMTWHKRWME